MPKNEADFAAELNRLLGACGMSLRQVAGMVPCSPGTLSKLRAGQHHPTMPIARALDRVLDAGGRLVDLAVTRQRTPATAAQPGPGLLAGHANLTMISRPPGTGHGNPVSGWPAWFGLKLAQLITQTDAWPALAGLGTLQMLLNQEISMSDGAVPPRRA